jgi:AraC family transcriptional regulator
MSNPISGIFPLAQTRMSTAQLLRACQHQAWLKTCNEPVAKALWFIESLYLSDLTLDDVAAIAGVRRNHLVRAFALATGYPVLRYVRGRRLTEAARLLANGPPDVLAVALEYGYSSHESFTRAFRDEFGVSPEKVRAQRHLDHLELVEPARMDEASFIDLEPPRFVDGDELVVAGICRRHNAQTAPSGIPVPWRRFASLMHRIPGRIEGFTYGVRCNADDHGNLDYVCAVEVADLGKLPAEFHRVRIPAQRYAVFTHPTNVSEVRRSFHTIWNRWLPASDCEIVEAPDFERYDHRFDPATGEGGFEIWVPVRSRMR